jgi:putative hydroxymethylpyrimidine transport system substrate-binding protein
MSLFNIFFSLFKINIIIVVLSSSVMALTPIKISLDWLLNPHHAPLILGIEKGIFEAEGLDVTLIGSIGSLEGCKQVSARNVDFAITNEPQLFIQTAKGLNLKSVCTLIPTPLEVFISRVPLSELKGKRIGHCSSGVGFSAAVLKEILEKQNIELDEVDLIYTRQGLMTTFISGQVDAVTNLYQPYEVADLKSHIQDFLIYPFEEIGIPSFAAMILVSHSKVPAEIQDKLINGLQKSCEFLKTYPDEAWSIFISHKTELDTPINRQEWKNIIALFEVQKLDGENPRLENLKIFLRKHELIA